MLRPTNRKTLYSVLAIFGAFGLYLMGASTSTPALKRSSEEIFRTGQPTLSQMTEAPSAGLATIDAPEYAILVATYAGSEHGRGIVRITRDVLREEGFPRTDIVGYPDKLEGEFDRFELLVGRAARTAELNGLLGQIRKYPGLRNDPLPFRDAYVVEVPEALRSGG